MNGCDFKPVKKGAPLTKYRCVRCGYVTPKELSKAPNKSSKLCPIQLGNPGTVSRTTQWASANARWEAKGKPVRSDVQVLRIVEQACMKCYAFTGSQCTECGCGIYKPEDERTQVIGIKFDPARFNKPRMATEDCPLHCHCGHSKWKHLNGPCECGRCPEFVDVRAPKPP